MSDSWHKSLIFHNILIAISYFFLGVLNLELAIPPGYSTILFPSAGIALIAALHGGPSLLFGVFAGSFLMNCWVGANYSLSSILLAICIASGSTLQAYLGAYAIKHYLKGEWSVLGRKRDLFTFYLVGGPVSCLVSSSIGSFSLFLLTDISNQTALVTWFNWWLGDSIGVIISAPLILAFLYKRDEIWHDRITQVLLPSLIAISISIVYFSYTLVNEHSRINTFVHKAGSDVINKINTKIKAYEEIVASIAHIKGTFPELTYLDFIKLTNPIFRQNLDLQALSWNPYVPFDTREEFEKSLGSQLNKNDFHILEKDATGAFIPAAQRTFYVPIQYITPVSGNLRALGYDIASNDIRLNAIKQAIFTQKAAITAPITLVQETGISVGALLIYPLFKEEGGTLIGVSVGVIRMQNMMQDILQENIHDGLKIVIKDSASNLSEKNLFQTGTVDNEDATDYSWHTPLEINGRTWVVSIIPSRTFVAKNQSLIPWQVLMMGILLSITLQTFLMILTARNFATTQKIKLSASVFENAHEGIMITDTKGVILDTNPTFSDITGYSKNEIVGKNARILSANYHPDSFFQNMWEELTNFGTWQGEIWNRKKNGELFAELLSISAIADYLGQRSYYVGLFSDITTHKEQQKTLEIMAHYDVLTGLPNRVLFGDRAKQAIAHSDRTGTLLAICFLDIDYFKQINDTYGHHVGDKVITEVANRIQSAIRADNTVSRLGGDEFTMLLGDLATKKACEVAVNRVLSAITKPLIIDGQTYNITASCGITLYPNDAADLDTLVRHADQSMYKAKLAGRNQYQFFDVSYDLNTTQKYLLLQEVEDALIKDELCLFYQPKVNMLTGRVFGLEALIRWQHPEKGLVPPLEFLPLLDGTELELKIGDWVIQTALEQMQTWSEMGLYLEVSVNISSHHLQAPLFTEYLRNQIAQHPKVYPNNFQLEVLESSALGDLNKVNQVLQACREQVGVQIALDDFGTGYSSLTHLRSLISQTIKIDQSFVRDILDDPNDYAIIDGIIALSSSFNRDLIAEGVETTEHGLMLLSMGCVNAQGYQIARPMAANEVEGWLANYSPNPQWLSFAEQPSNSKSALIYQMRLVFSRWFDLYEKAIHCDTNTEPKWPIIDKKQSHKFALLEKAQSHHLFKFQELTQLEQAHSELHTAATQGYNAYLSENNSKALAKLTEVTHHYQVLISILDRLA